MICMHFEALYIIFKKTYNHLIIAAVKEAQTVGLKESWAIANKNYALWKQLGKRMPFELSLTKVLPRVQYFLLG